MADNTFDIDPELLDQAAKESPVDKMPYMIYTKKSIGYADGYSNYKSKTAAHNPDGSTIEVNINQGAIKDNGGELIKSNNSPMMLDNHSNKFRTIKGYGNTQNDFEDPTFLIFDLTIMNSESPLFSQNTKNFITEYSKLVPELRERLGYWDELTHRLLQIFPGDYDTDGVEKSGTKRHYIESVGGLDNLTKLIVDYPADLLTFTITEDISMTLQYLSELYNNLVYSYDTHRYLIPDNLLRFNMKITIRDVRNMKNDNSEVNENISKFIYVLHDCQFEFFGTKSFATDIKRSGFGTPQASFSAGGSINMNYKSVSKITAPLLKNNSRVVDFREKDRNFDYKTSFDGDYKSKDDVIEEEKISSQKDIITYKKQYDIYGQYVPADTESLIRTNIDLIANKSKLPPGIHLPEINTNYRGFVDLLKDEATDIRNVIIGSVYDEVNKLITRGERWFGDNLGFTVGKVNVYYDSLEGKIDNISSMFSDILDKSSNILNKGIDSGDLSNVWGDILDNSEDTLNKFIDPKYSRVKPLQKDNLYDLKEKEVLIPGRISGGKNDNDKKLDKPTIDLSTHTGPSAPKKTVDLSSHTGQSAPKKKIDLSSHTGPSAPKKTVDLSSTPHPDKKTVRIYKDGIYNEKYPEGDLMEDGTYNEKYPEGDVNPDGIYNNKPPSGNIYGKIYKDLPPVKLKNIYK